MDLALPQTPLESTCLVVQILGYPKKPLPLARMLTNSASTWDGGLKGQDLAGCGVGAYDLGMSREHDKARRWQFSLHRAFVVATLLAVALAIGGQGGWAGLAVACVLMVIFSPLLVAIYIVAALAAEWISERMSDWSR